MRRSKTRIGTRGAGRRFAVDRQGQAGARTGARPPVHGGGDRRGALPRAAWPRTHPPGLAGKLHALRSAATLEYVVREMVSSAEFSTRILPETGSCPPAAELHIDDARPLSAGHLSRSRALSGAQRRRHRRHGAADPASIAITTGSMSGRRSSTSTRRRSPAIVRGLGARSCFELGCFTGPVLSLLAESGIARRRLRGQPYRLRLRLSEYSRRDAVRRPAGPRDRPPFDVVLVHGRARAPQPAASRPTTSRRLPSLVRDDGRLFEFADVGGRRGVRHVAADRCLDEWRSVGDGGFWREWPCDEAGWPRARPSGLGQSELVDGKIRRARTRRDIAASSGSSTTGWARFSTIRRPGAGRCSCCMAGRDSRPRPPTTARLDAALAPAAGLGP